MKLSKKVMVCVGTPLIAVGGVWMMFDIAHTAFTLPRNWGLVVYVAVAAPMFVMGFAGTILFGKATLKVLVLDFWRCPAITINNSGIFFPMAEEPFADLGWGNVYSVYNTGTDYLNIDLKISPQRDGMTGLCCRVNRWFGLGDFVYPLKNLKANKENIWSQIDELAPSHVLRNQRRPN